MVMSNNQATDTGVPWAKVPTGRDIVFYGRSTVDNWSFREREEAVVPVNELVRTWADEKMVFANIAAGADTGRFEMSCPQVTASTADWPSATARSDEEPANIYWRQLLERFGDPPEDS